MRNSKYILMGIILLLFNNYSKSMQSYVAESLNSTSAQLDSINTIDNTNTGLNNKVIVKEDTVNGNVTIDNANLTVYGVVNGDVMVFGGNLILKSTSKINGNAQVIGGKIIKEEGAIVTGYEDYSDTSGFDFNEPPVYYLNFDYSFDVPWQSEITTFDKFIIRYNCVESIFLGLGRNKKFYWDGQQQWNAFGSIGWGFKSHTWRGNLGITRQFAKTSEEGSSLYEVGVEGYSLTETGDHWIISTLENTLSAFLLHEDFQDYFEREGATVHAAYYLNQEGLKAELKMAFIADTYDSLSNKVDWALFGGKKTFRLNPHIEPGRMRSLFLFGGLSTITKSRAGFSGWCIQASAEIANKNWGGEFNFDQYILEVQRYQPIDKYSNFNVRLKLGTGCGYLPHQRIFEIGGLGTMNAYPFKSEIGNRMMLINMEFLFKGQILDDLDFIPFKIFNYVNLLLISDAGFTRSVPNSWSALNGFGDLKWNEFKHDFGIALASRNGNMRIGCTWRTDKSESIKLLLRISRPF